MLTVLWSCLGCMPKKQAKRSATANLEDPKVALSDIECKNHAVSTSRDFELQGTSRVSSIYTHPSSRSTSSVTTTTEAFYSAAGSTEATSSRDCNSGDDHVGTDDTIQLSPDTQQDVGSQDGYSSDTTTSEAISLGAVSTEAASVRDVGSGDILGTDDTLRPVPDTQPDVGSHDGHPSEPTISEAISPEVTSTEAVSLGDDNSSYDNLVTDETLQSHPDTQPDNGSQDDQSATSQSAAEDMNGQGNSEEQDHTSVDEWHPIPDLQGMVEDSESFNEGMANIDEHDEESGPPDESLPIYSVTDDLICYEDID